MIYGYARCSTSESKQDINRQVKELKAAGAEEIYLEYEHGDKKIKPQQQQMLDQAQAGDTIITLEVHKKILRHSALLLVQYLLLLSARFPESDQRTGAGYRSRCSVLFLR